MIRFEDYFALLKNKRVKVKFNMNAGDPRRKAWDYLLEDGYNWMEMNAWRKKRTSNDLDRAEFLLSFAQYYPYGPNFYIFGGLYKITKITPEIDDGIGYSLELQQDFIEYRKRLIIKLENPIGRDLYCRNFESVQNSKLNPEIYEIAPSTKLGDFPGYNKVLLTHSDLQTIIKQDAPEWKNALSSVKGVYCITDTSTGELYIGSASGECGIWQRWSSYANVKNLTGGNKTFEELKNRGADYIIDNFTYSILEIFDIRTNKDDVIHREEYWKKVFKTVEYGMNN